ncbi:MAG: Tol-Pal system beta propeller repeat protein TolB [bacterium]
MMLSFKSKLALPGLIVLFCATTLCSQTDVFLRIYTKTFQRMEVDVYPFVGTPSGKDSDTISGLITEVLSNDLWMSGFFKVNTKWGLPQESSNNSKEGGDENSKALAWVAGEFRYRSNEINVQPHVVDGASGRTIIRKDYRDRFGRERYAVHRIADDIVYRLTGEKGVAESKIAFVHQNKAGTKEIALMDYDGHKAKEITRDKSINLSPAWSPDGSKICYTSYKDGNPNLYVLNLRTNTQSLLSDLQGLNSAPAWSPDGTRIALTLTKDGNAEIYILSVEKKKFRRLTFNRAIDSSPSWSPSGREIAFTSDRSGSPQIYIMDSDGANVRRLTFEGSYNASPDWSPRGDKIAYVSRTQTGFDIFTIDVTGENMMQLTQNSGSNEDPSWSPNGFALIFSSSRSGSKQIYSMFWDGSDPKRLTSGGTNYSPAWSPRINY